MIATVDTKWTLGEALALIRALQPEFHKMKYHMTMGGGVLNRGWSDKDLDLYVHPFSKEEKHEVVLEYLTKLWGEGKDLANGGYSEDEISIYRVRKKFDYSGLRVDVFIL